MKKDTKKQAKPLPIRRSTGGMKVKSKVKAGWKVNG